MVGVVEIWFINSGACATEVSLEAEQSKTKHPHLKRMRRLLRKESDVRVDDVALYFLPIEFRVPLRFASAVVSHITCARVQITVVDTAGRRAVGWGEVPLSVHWAWPSDIPYEERLQRLKIFCRELTQAWGTFESWGHAMEIGYDFQQEVLTELMRWDSATHHPSAMPYLAALLCCSAFDIALHDAYGNLNHRDTYTTYNARFMNRDLSAFLTLSDDEVKSGETESFSGRYPEDYLVSRPPQKLAAWHLVGGMDPLTQDDLSEADPEDGFPVLLADWIQRDGLLCLKIKLRGNDADWDYKRLVQVGDIACQQGVQWISADFNCMVNDPLYVTDILDRLECERRRIFQMLMYVEQPFPYELERDRIDVRSVAARKPIYLDESAHDWKYVALGYQLGWSGVALKTCKTQTGALLSHCWARSRRMPVMVQDLTNPMLAQIPHVRLAAHVGTIMGVETNAMQYYPEASASEAIIHSGLYRRRNGHVDLSTIAGAGFGYRVDEIQRTLPGPSTKSPSPYTSEPLSAY